MSQYKLTGETPGGPVLILVGWDNPMSWFFLVIMKSEDDEPLYSNLYEKSPHRLDLPYFQSVLERFGIQNISLSPGHHSGLYEKLIADRENTK
ncbi:hypothetical protein THOKLE017_P30060 (plasmid) [Klebsiella pneumoniae]|nr:hypothetical protein THOKLE017_P30060 [Klebsiella pneumoniae]